MITTPHRPQQRRTRHTTISSDNAMSTSSKLPAVESLPALRFGQTQFRTPPQQQSKWQAIKLQRQHSVSCCTPTAGKLTPPQFGRRKRAKGESPNSRFAGSKFMDSPAVESIPMPPANWFIISDLVGTTSSRVQTSPTPSSFSDSLLSGSSFEDSKSTSSDELLPSSASDSLLSGSSFEDTKSVSSDESLTLFEHHEGLHVNPKHLIAVIAASV